MMYTNRKSFMIKCGLAFLLTYFCVYVLTNAGTNQIIRELQSGNFANMQEQQTLLLKVQQAELLATAAAAVPPVLTEGGVFESVSAKVTTTSLSTSTSTSPKPTEKSIDEKVKEFTNCLDKPMIPKTQQRGDYWVLYNYVQAERKFLCHESITYTTHADYSFLDNLVPLLERWQGPISIALHAPGTDFKNTLDSIAYLRDCTDTPLVKELVTFHIYFSTKHVPHEVPHHNKVLRDAYNCSLPAPYSKVNTAQMYKAQKRLLYPVNVGRNIAREMAQTHYILPSDIELYPSRNIIPQFLRMIADARGPLLNRNPKVFPLHLFEVNADAPVPDNKTMLKEMLENKTAIPFHKKLCSGCHSVPKSKEWQEANETSELAVFHVGKRNGHYVHWEPIFIGTHADPLYDERLSWEGKSDKMTQGYTLCVLDYDFLILNNPFLVHRPGIKKFKRDKNRDLMAGKTNQLIKKVIFPELKVLYGFKKGCAV